MCTLDLHMLQPFFALSLTSLVCSTDLFGHEEKMSVYDSGGPRLHPGVCV